MDDMMMMEEKKEEDEGPNGCIKCLGATWEVIYVSIICLITSFREYTPSSNLLS